MTGYDENSIGEILKKNRKVAVVGISDKPDRDSYRVAEYLSRKGYKIYPVNPTLKEWNGVRAYPDLKSIPRSEGIEIVDVFRKPEAVLPIAQEAVEVGAKVLWLQEGVVNKDAADLAHGKGLKVVMDRCMMKEVSRTS
ncbi:MAG: CoA-binding protein [Candidatus Thermoplasmatota archaeon]|jgi:predicted CoA-binding protein|nr:CoA-binding protein [Candidatus Thermoplasmatota archaeon]MCL5785983.1 CoA-binding protein [Candidatus Thermoplasmatota archaeon]